MLHLTRRIPARVWVALTAVLGLGAALLGTTALAPRAEAATLTQVSAFGSNPGNLNMYVYRPATLPDNAPLVVLLHGCSQDAATYHAHSGWAKYADSLGFALVYAEQKSANNSSSCFNWFQKSDTARGSGEAQSIRSMVDYAVRTYSLDEERVYISGLSAGGAMAS